MDLNRKNVGAATGRLAVSLARQIGEHKVIDDADLLEGFAGDESHCAPAMPDLVVRAQSKEDILAALTLAEKHGVPITPRAGGTGKAGGAIPVLGGVVLDVSRMNQLKGIDRVNLTAVAEPGLITGEFQQAVENEGLFYPPDPNSLENCCLGGNVAHNSGGPRAFKYGVTSHYVLGLGLGMIGGTHLTVGKQTIKGVAGYDVTSLLVGSEGTLGVFTEMTLRLLVKPPELSTLLVRFSDEIAAGRAIASIVEHGLVPRVMEFMDQVLVETLIQSGAGSVPQGTGALLLVELDGPNEELVETQSIELAELCEKQGAIDVLMARHVGERNQLWAARRGLSDAVKKRAKHKVAEDIVVPRSRAAELLEQLRELSVTHRTLIASYGHAGDGNFHVNVLWDDPAFDPEPVIGDLFRLVLGMGGTITGEHGIGIAKQKYLPWEKSAADLALQKGIKQLYDPLGLMNPGKIF